MSSSPSLLHRLTRTATLVAVLLAATVSTSVAAEPAPLPTCNLWVAVDGSDLASGTVDAPLRTVQGLVARLLPGEVGCLAAGATFAEDVRVDRGGTRGAPITITSADPQAPATIAGRLYVTDAANDVSFTHLVLDGRNDARLPSPSISGDRVSFINDEVTNEHTGICFDIGSSLGWGTAVDTVIDRSRIHACGTLPRTNHDHGIYDESSINARITNNWIYDNADRGVQLYPDARGTLIAHNVIYGSSTGIIISGDHGMATSDAVIEGNVIARSERYDVESWWPDGNPIGTGNLVRANCLAGTGLGSVADHVGFVVTEPQVVADPQLVDPAAGDLSLTPGSRCAGFGPTEGPGIGPAAPDSPAALRVAGATGTTVSIRWLAPADTSDVVAYRVAVDGRRSFVTTDTSARLGDLRPGVRLHVSVAALNAGGGTSIARVIAVQTLAARAPAVRIVGHGRRWLVVSVAAGGVPSLLVVDGRVRAHVPARGGRVRVRGLRAGAHTVRVMLARRDGGSRSSATVVRLRG